MDETYKHILSHKLKPNPATEYIPSPRTSPADRSINRHITSQQLDPLRRGRKLPLRLLHSRRDPLGETHRFEYPCFLLFLLSSLLHRPHRLMHDTPIPGLRSHHSRDFRAAMLDILCPGILGQESSVLLFDACGLGLVLAVLFEVLVHFVPAANLVGGEDGGVGFDELVEV